MSVDVKAGDRVARCKILCECAVAAADIEDVFSGAYPSGEEFSAFRFEHGKVGFAFA